MSGAPILKEQTFVYKGKKRLDFYWEDVGINMHFPAAKCVEPIKISVAVAENVAKHSILPPQYRHMSPASAAYKITTSAPLPTPVKIRMEHCAILEKDDSPAMMVARGGPPYYFKPLNDAIFPLKWSYSEIELQRFCFLCNFFDWVKGKPMQLSAQVLYHDDDTATFVVTKDLQGHINAVRDEVPHIHVEDKRMSCYPLTTYAIKLSVPMCSNGWDITPNFKPAEITIEHINEYIEKTSSIPKINLRKSQRESGNPEESVSIPVEGGSITSFALLCKLPTPADQPAKSLLAKLQRGKLCNLDLL